MDPKKATELERVDALELQLSLARIKCLQAEQATLVTQYLHKYGNDGEYVTFDGNGNIVRAPLVPAALASVPAGE